MEASEASRWLGERLEVPEGLQSDCGYCHKFATDFERGQRAKRLLCFG